jgi:hypothetical protein
MADADLVKSFWLDVQEKLTSSFSIPEHEARQAISNYRRRLLDVDALDVVYHDEPAKIAQAIHGGRFMEEPHALVETRSTAVGNGSSEDVRQHVRDSPTRSTP